VGATGLGGIRVTNLRWVQGYET